MGSGYREATLSHDLGGGSPHCLAKAMSALEGGSPWETDDPAEIWGRISAGGSGPLGAGTAAAGVVVSLRSPCGPLSPSSGLSSDPFLTSLSGP